MNYLYAWVTNLYKSAMAIKHNTMCFAIGSAMKITWKRSYCVTFM